MSKSSSSSMSERVSVAEEISNEIIQTLGGVKECAFTPEDMTGIVEAVLAARKLRSLRDRIGRAEDRLEAEKDEMVQAQTKAWHYQHVAALRYAAAFNDLVTLCHKCYEQEAIVRKSRFQMPEWERALLEAGNDDDFVTQ